MQLGPTHGATTPRQRYLWNMILPAETNGDSPGSTSPPRLSLSCADPATPLRTRSDYGCETNSSPSKIPRRQRLVDTLQSQRSSSRKPPSESEKGSCKPSASKDDTERHDAASSPRQKEPSTSLRAPVLQAAGLKLTYARQRSYLTESDSTENLNHGVSEPQPRLAQSGKRSIGLTNSLTRFQFDEQIDEGPNSESTPQAAPLRSIHELREAGGNVRLLTEIEILVDDIEDRSSSLSSRRGRLLELGQRLEEAPVQQLFTEHAFGMRLLTCLANDGDPILKTLFAAAILKLVSGFQSLQTVKQLGGPPLVELLVSLLELDEDMISIAKNRDLNMSKAVQSDLRKYWNGVRNSNAWRAGTPSSMTPHVLALQCLEYMVRLGRELGQADQILERQAVMQVVRLLDCSVSSCPSPSHESPSTEFRLVVSILESCTIAVDADSERYLWADATLEPIANLLPSMFSRFRSIPEALTALTLRLYLNITNNNPQACAIFSKPNILRPIFEIVISHFELVSCERASKNLKLDSLILALGTLINLAEWNTEVPRFMMELQYQDLAFLQRFFDLFQTNISKTAEVREAV